MKRYLYLYIIVATSLASLLTSCKRSEVEPEFPVDGTPQTTLMYMTGTDLSYFYSQNITAAEKAVKKGALGAGRFLIFKHSSKDRASLFELRYFNGEYSKQTLKTYNDITSLSQEAIKKVVADVTELAPADSYNLIVSGHGTGWVLKDDLTSSWNRNQAPRAPSIWSQDLSNPLLITRYIGSENDSYFNIEELKEGLESTGVHFGCLIFDMCFMSSVELLYDLRSCSDYIVASPCEIMGNGIPYDTAIPYLYRKNGTTFDLQGLCQTFVNYYTSYTIPSGCIAMTKCSELDELARLTREVNSQFADQSELNDELQVYERLEKHIFFDFGQYITTKCSDTTLSEEFTAQFNRTFPLECRLHTPRFFANIGPYASSANNYEAYYTDIDYYSGITTSAPSSQFREEWKSTAWAQATYVEQMQ